MTRCIQSAVRNRLLRSMTSDTFDFLAPDLTPVSLPISTVLEIPGKPIEWIVFIESGIAARMIVGHGTDLAESGHIGFEGMTGKPIIQGGAVATNKIYMQVGGKGFSIPAPRLVEAMRLCNELSVLLRRYVMACEVQVEHTLLAATTRLISQRLARWLLMYHDRVDGNELKMTHDLLAAMLHVRRSGITNALHILEGEHAIQSERGIIRIIDRNALKVLAAGSYGIPEEAYESLIPPIVSEQN